MEFVTQAFKFVQGKSSVWLVSSASGRTELLRAIFGATARTHGEICSDGNG
jgi:ABC-type transporter Mla maintaining outer membrane lipid asymmetry ATPase subunit MlaF